MNNSKQCIICGEPLGDDELLVFVTHDGECSRMLAETEESQKKDRRGTRQTGRKKMKLSGRDGSEG